MATEGFSTGNGSGLFGAQWNGASWKTKSIPMPTGSTSIGLVSISCQGTSSCMAVGAASFDGVAGVTPQPLAEQWNGTSWTVLGSPTISPQGQFNGVSCKATSCEAVGGLFSGSSGQVLVDGWNGSSWALQAAPNPNSTNAVLTSVRCTQTPAFACTAVGYFSGTKHIQPLAERYS
jgi:hypothetical protein